MSFTRLLRPLWLSLAALTLVGCSVRRIVTDGLAGALASSGEAFAQEDDPEIARAALPFALKTMEAVLLEDPEQAQLLVTTCAGYTQYAYAFVEGDAARIEGEDYEESTRLRERALRLYLRARDYGLRALELRHSGLGDELRKDPSQAVERLEAKDVEAAYWTASSWGLAISSALDRPEIAADLDAVRLLLARCLELDEAFGGGSIHEALITIEALPEAMGGSPERARVHYLRALELSEGERAGPHLSFAQGLSVPAQDRAEFEQLLGKALAVDVEAAPASRLANRISQERAARLLERADDLFFEPLD